MSEDGRNALDRVHRDISKLRAVEDALLPGPMRLDEDTRMGLYYVVEEVRADLEDASENLKAMDHPPNGGKSDE